MKGLLHITPVTFKWGFKRKNANIDPPPIECPTKKQGISVLISFIAKTKSSKSSF